MYRFSARSSLISPVILFCAAVLLTAALPLTCSAQTAPPFSAKTITVARTVFVDDTYGSDDPTSGGLRERQDRPFKTLEAAVSASSAGDTIVVRPGVYQAQAFSGVTISKAKLRIVGYGATLQTTNSTDTTRIHVQADNVTIEGLEIDGLYTGSSATGADGGLIDIVAQANCSVLHCYIHNSGADGVRAVGLTPGFVVDTCRFDNCFQGVICGGAPNNCRLTHNEISSPIGTKISGGLRIEFAYNMSGYGYLIADNRIDGSYALPIEVWGGSTAHKNYKVLNNTVHGPSIFGISCDNGQNVTISGNQVFGAGCGIEVPNSSAHVLVANNLVDGFDDTTNTIPPGALISISNTVVHDVTISGNELRNSSGTPDPTGHTGAIHLLGAEHINVLNNDFCTDSSCLRIQDSNNVLVQGNKFRSTTDNTPMSGHVIFIDATGMSDNRNIDIVNNVFDTGAPSFVCFSSSTVSTFSHCRVSNNMVTYSGNSPFCNNALLFAQATGGAVSFNDLIISGNTPETVNPQAAQFFWLNGPPILNLPTTDPHVPGQAWFNGRAVTISNG